MPVPAAVAIVGVGCRLPGGVSSLDQLETLLLDGASGWGPVPRDRWHAAAFHNPQAGSKGTLPSRNGYFLRDCDVSLFDARFFHIAPQEAHTMDPQQRLLLQTTYEALENAGIPLEDVRGSDTSVFVSGFAYDYNRMGFKDMQEVAGQHFTGSGIALLANRLSYCFDLRGASMTIDTGCSGSLVALHQACASLRSGESTMSIVGGSQLLLDPDQSINMGTLGMANPDGHCYAFDSRGNGYVRGEGVATMVLKLLDNAIADGDHIHGVVVNTGLNQDGKTPGSIMSPSGDAQRILMESVYAAAGLDPAETPYVEAHGTGTQIGDKEEVQSIYRVFCEGKVRRSDLVVGSIKSNVGHLEASAGIAGLLKSLVVMRTGLVPRQLNIVEFKPTLKLEERNITIPLRTTPLGQGPARVSVNSFGYGGANSHVILESLSSFTARQQCSATDRKAPAPNGSSLNGGAPSNGLLNGRASNGVEHAEHMAADGPRGQKLVTNGVQHNKPMLNGNHRQTNGDSSLPHKNGGLALEPKTNGHQEATPAGEAAAQLFVLSANSDKSLAATVQGLQNWIKTHKETPHSLTDLAYTLTARRSLLSSRISIVASDLAQLADKLADKQSLRPTKASGPKCLAFVFTGQGAQWSGMGRELMTTSRVFADSIRRSESIMRALGCDWSLTNMFSDSLEVSRLGDAKVAQPATTALQVALVDLLTSLGISPSCVVGHSSGEIGAAYAAGALDQLAAIQVAFLRGVCSAEGIKSRVGAKGSMMATGLGEDAILPFIAQTKHKGVISIACVNSPQSTTISGDEPAIDELKALLDAQSIFARKLRVDTAYHSHHMRPVGERYQRAIGGVDMPPARKARDSVAFYSTVVGERKTGLFEAEYWVQNLVSPVRFSAGLQLAREQMREATGGSDDGLVFVEIGPAAALAGPAKQTLSVGGKGKFAYLSPLSRGTDARLSTLDLLGQLVQLGCTVDRKKIVASMSHHDDDDHHHRKPQLITDLPTYPFDEASYWRESRLSSRYRLRPFPKHDLCGLFDPASSALEPRWTHRLNANSLPWLRDHVVDNSIVFPAAGSVCMAVEAMRQLVQMRNVNGSKTPDVKSFVVSNVAFVKAISMPLDQDGAEVELQLTITPSKEAGARWEEFRVSSHTKVGHTDGVWEENCSGLIRADKQTAVDDEVDGGREDGFRAAAWLQILRSVQQETTDTLGRDSLYEQLKASGNHYGPGFALLGDLHFGKDVAWTQLTVPDYAAAMPGHHLEPHLMHPTVLDAISHLGAQLFKPHCFNAPVVVGSVLDMSIPASTACRPNTELHVATTLEPQDARSCVSRAYVFQKGDDGCFTPVLQSKYILRAFAAGSQDASGEVVPFQDRKAHQMAWNADVDFLTSPVFSQVLHRKGLAAAPEEAEHYLHAIELAASIFLQHTLGRVAKSMVTKPHLERLFAWAEQYCASPECRELLRGTQSFEEQAHAVTAAETSAFGHEGKLVARVGRKLSDIMLGKTDALALMQKDGLLEKFYQGGLFAATYRQMAEYVQTLAFKHPRMKFLEIGAGTGVATAAVLESISHDDGSVWLDRYDCTDSSTGSFEHAKQKLSRWSDHLDFRVLDIEKDPQAQGFQEHSYDVIVAANVLHATKHMANTMANVRKLLRPGGKLILAELTQPTVAMNLVLGTVPGWWAFEDGRAGHPLLSSEQWNTLLRDHGYSGLDIVANNTPTKSATSSLMVATAAGPSSNKDASTPRVEIIQGCKDSAVIQDLTKTLSSASKAAGQEWTSAGPMEALKTKAGLPDGDNTTFIVLDVAENALLLREDQKTFEALRDLLMCGSNIIWVALQESSSPVATSAKSMMQGTARVLRRENGGSSRLITVEILDPLSTGDVSSSQRICSHLQRVVQLSLDPSREDYESELYLRNTGEVLIPRVQPDSEFLSWVDSRVSSQTKLAETRYHQADRPLRLQVGAPGLLSSMRFVDDDGNTNNLGPVVPSTRQPLQPWEIQVSTRAHGVNFKDVFIALGQMKAGVTMVGEIAGVVTAVGADMQDRYSLGDRVLGFGGTAFASAPRISGHLAHVLPDGLSFAEGASIPVVYATAYYSMFDVAKLRKGQSILIAAASGGVGQAAIQLAKYAGAGDIFVTVGSAAKKQLVMDTYGIPDSHVFSSRGVSFKEGILRITKGRGVDVVLNSLAGEMLTEAFDCVARLGTFVEIGKADIYKDSQIRMAPFDRSITFASVDLIALAQDAPERVYETLAAVIGLFERGSLRAPSPINRYAIGKIEDAFRLIAGRKHTGKIVLESENDSSVTAVVARPKPLKLTTKGTYVVAGGLGDVGRRLASFLASHGAGHVVLLSRRTLDPEARKSLESSISAFGTTLHIVKCDITKDSDVSACVDYCKSLPPVKGIVHGGMVLRDRPFADMSYDDFRAALGPKVYGTINLDNAFGSPDLDFFITLSSVTTQIGNGSQANYVAGNAFQDAFAHAKMASPSASKTRYMALDLGALEGSDAVKGIANSSRLNVIMITFDEFFQSIEYAMNTQQGSNQRAQSILGLSREAMVAADDAASLSNPLFRQLSYQQTSDEQDAASSGGKKLDLEQAIRSAKTLGEAETLISEAIIAKCAVFLDQSIEEVPTNQPMSTIGLDSLVSIELKNWLLRAFQATVQTADISRAASVLALASAVTTKSKLISDEVRDQAASQDNATHGAAKSKAASNAPAIQSLHGLECCKAAKDLPKYPLPNLRDALQALEKNVSLFATSNKELEGLKKAVRDFQEPGGLGQKMYQKLVDRYNDPSLDSWLADLHLKGLYLLRRHPLAPWNNFLKTHHDSKRRHTQAERAALVSTVAFRFLQEVEAKTLEPDIIAGQSLCTYSWAWMFNAVREPHVGCDEMQRYPGNNYVAVLRRGHAFTIPLLENGAAVSLKRLQSAFQSILDRDIEDESWAGILTTDTRDSWGKNRDTLIALTPANEAYFEAIERSAFVVCLDEGSPETNEDLVRQCYLGDGANRWHDKCTSFLVSSNGRSGQLSEHSMFDGLTVGRMIEWIHDAIQSHTAENGVKTINGNGMNGHAAPKITSYSLRTTPDIDQQILSLRQKYLESTSIKKYALHKSRSLGIMTARGTGVSSKGCVDMALQLANRLHFGYNPGSWEPVSTQHFHRGRPELIQVCTQSVVDFCETAADGSRANLSEKKRLLQKAVEEWETQVREAGQGRGFLRLWDTLMGMVPEDEEKPAIFTDPVFWRAFPGMVTQGRNEAELQDVAIGVAHDGGLWISYSIQEEQCTVSIVGTSGKVEQYQACLDKAADTVRSIVRSA